MVCKIICFFFQTNKITCAFCVVSVVYAVNDYIYCRLHQNSIKSMYSLDCIRSVSVVLVRWSKIIKTNHKSLACFLGVRAAAADVNDRISWHTSVTRQPTLGARPLCCGRYREWQTHTQREREGGGKREKEWSEGASRQSADDKQQIPSSPVMSVNASTATPRKRRILQLKLQATKLKYRTKKHGIRDN